uniref:Matrin-type domain-containing protein n=1 Tax=Wuchereria bancrofti TaxID=6293 RepID=A0AAF5Q6K4_WUCBA
MMDVWKSNARRFCEIYKVWFADNRVNIEHHEGGQKHKAKSDLQATLAMMESAASKSMRIGDSCPSAGIAGPVPKPKKYMDPRAQSASIAEMTQQKKAEYKTENEKYDPESETVWVKARQTMVHIQPQNYYTAEQYAIKLAVMENKTDAVASNQVTEPNKLKSVCRTASSLAQQETAGISKAPKVPQSAFSHSETEKIILEERNAEEISSSKLPQHYIIFWALSFISLFHSFFFIFFNSNQEKLTLNLTKEEPLEESSCNRFIQNEYSNLKEENIDIKNETEKITEEIIEQKSSPYDPWIPIEKIPEKPKVDWTTEEQGRGQASELILAPEDLVTFSDKSTIEFRKRKTTIKTRQSIDDQ